MISVRWVHIPVDNYGHWDCNNRKEDCVDCNVPGALDWDGIGIPESCHCRSHPDNYEEQYEVRNSQRRHWETLVSSAIPLFNANS